jgi:hypothetical protein
MNFGINTDANESDTMLKLPLEVTVIEYSFSAGSTSGNISLQRLFTRNSDNEFNVVSITSCFGGSSGAT